MVIRIVRLGSPRAEGEGTRIGTVRHRSVLRGLLLEKGAHIEAAPGAGKA